MDQNVKWFYRARAEAVAKVLQKNRMNATIVDDSAAAVEAVMGMIPPGSSVGMGGSMTLVQTGLLQRLRATEQVELLDRFAEGLSPEQTMAVMRASLTADVFISGVNAITEQGELVYVDCNGNRVAGVLFGPKKVIIITGCNKIVPNLAYAQERIRHFVAPANAKRLGRNTPCAETGQCQDCSSPARICNNTVVVHKQADAERLHVVMISQELGL